MRFVRAQRVALVDGANGIGEGAASRHDEEREVGRQELDRGEGARESVAKGEKGAADLDDGVDHVLELSQHSRSRATANAVSAPAARGAPVARTSS